MEIRASDDAANTGSHMLYEASMRGCVATLHTLIQNDPFILHKISLTSFGETPLHISALLGHLDFTKALVSKKPQLVTELDSFKRSPLHLASAAGHKEIVKELLQVDRDACLAADQEGRIPLHLAAMRGRVEVIKELISAKRESVFEQLHGDTILHLCVRYNHLDALKLLLASVDDEEFLNSKNHEGKTILQVSALLKQFETINYLLSEPKIRVDVNSLMENGFAAFDAGRNGTVQRNLHEPVIETTTKIQSIQSPKNLKATPRKEAQAAAAQSSITWKKFQKLLKYRSDYYEKTRGNLMMVAALIAQMSFQVGTNPPGGYWDKDAKNQDEQTCPQGKTCIAGTSIHAYTHEKDYDFLVTFSTLSFTASLSIILWLISGVPLRNRVFVGILILGMWATVLFAATAYFFSIKLVGIHDDMFHHIASIYPDFWLVVVGAIILIHIFRFCWWLLKKLVMCVVCLVRCCFCKKKEQAEPQHPLVVTIA